MSFYDYPWLRCFRPRLTTIDLPKYELGAKGAQLLLKRISGMHGRSTVQKLEPQLCVRESCGFTLHLRNVDRKAFPDDSQKGKDVELPPHPTLVREKPADHQAAPMPTRD